MSSTSSQHRHKHSTQLCRGTKKVRALQRLTWETFGDAKGEEFWKARVGRFQSTVFVGKGGGGLFGHLGWGSWLRSRSNCPCDALLALGPFLVGAISRPRLVWFFFGFRFVGFCPHSHSILESMLGWPSMWNLLFTWDLQLFIIYYAWYYEF
jgi:hypothetical protein